MKNEIAIGSMVEVITAYEGAARPGMFGRVIGEATSGDLVVNFGDDFPGHHGGHTPFARGQRDGSRNLWFIPVTHVSVVTTPSTKPASATARPASAHSDRILNHLLAGNSISQLEAFGVYGIFRLAARIFDLRARGHKIVTKMKEDANGKPYAEYSLTTRRVR